MTKERQQEIVELEIQLDNYFKLIPGSSSHFKNKIKYYLHSKGSTKLIPLVRGALATDNWKEVKIYLKELW